MANDKVIKREDWMTCWHKVADLVPISKAATDDRCLFKFMGKLSKRINQYSVGPNFISEYLHFQLARLMNYESIKTFTGKITCDLMFGYDAVEYFYQRDNNPRWRNHHVGKEVGPEIIKKWIGWEDDKSGRIDGMMVHERKVHLLALRLPEEDRIYFCDQSSTLYRPSDTSCEQCSVKEECRKQQLIKYPHLKKKKAKKVE